MSELAFGRDGLVTALRRELASRADPARARALRRAQTPLTRPRDGIPLLGVDLAAARPALLAVIDAPEHRLGSRQAWEDAIRALWHDPPHRESRYLAIGLIRHPRHRAWARSCAATALYRDLITTGRSVDLVDPLAAHAVGPALRARPDIETPLVTSWAMWDGIWLRRAAILAQTRAHGATDRRLLATCIGANIEERHPLIRDAIRLALAAEARQGPRARAWVTGFLADQAPRLRGPLAAELRADFGGNIGDRPVIADAPVPAGSALPAT